METSTHDAVRAYLGSNSPIPTDVILVSGAYPRITDLQLLGYAYIKL